MDGFGKKPGGVRIFRVPVKVVDIPGGQKALGMEALRQSHEFSVRYVGIVKAVGAEQGAGKRRTGAEGIIQIKKLFSPAVNETHPGAGLPGIDIGAVMGIQPAVCMEPVREMFQEVFTYGRETLVVCAWHMEPVIAEKTISVIGYDSGRRRDFPRCSS